LSTVAAILASRVDWEPKVLAIDPTAPIAPMIPATPVGDANDPAKALLALARAAVANTASTLGEIAVGGSHADPDTVKAASGSGATASTALGASGQAQVEAPPQAALSTAERMAVAVRSAAAQAAPRQAGLAPMMANLDAAIALPETPEPVRQAARAVLDKALPSGQPVTATALREAVQGSGVFLEARLARAAVTPEALVPATEASGDMKAALLVLRAVVSTWLAKAPAVGPESRTFAPKSASEPRSDPARPISAPLPGSYAPTPRLDGQTAVYLAASIAPFDGAHEAPAPLAAPAPGQDTAKAATTAAPTPIIEAEAAETPPPEPSEARAGAPSTPTVRPSPSAPLPSLLMVGLIDEEVVDVAPSVSEDEEAAFPTPRGAGYVAARPQAPARPPPPYAGGPTTAQAAARSDLPRDMPAAELASRLLKDVGGAIARQELSQIASLPEAHHEAERAVETRSSRWVFDLPFQTPQGVAVAQFEISKDGGGGGAEGAREVERTWRARFSLDVEPLGPVHVHIALTGAMTRVGLWAERPEAMARLRAGEEALNAALRHAELTPEVAFHPGAPTAAATTLGHFVDRET
jgi:hypothetical protein